MILSDNLPRPGVVAYKPRHRADVTPDSTPATVCFQGRWCRMTFCRRHQPIDYATYMAAHATDSLPTIKVNR